MSSNTASSPPARSGLGAVYASLLDPSSNASSASILRAPVVFDTSNAEQQHDEALAKKQPLNSAALRFQPTKRPQLSTQKAKARPAFPKAPPPPGGANTATLATAGLGVHPAQPLVKTSIADWTGDDDDVNGFYGADRRQRGSRKKRRKNKEEPAAPQDWDDIYDPARPNSYEEYKHSEEKIREIREWKDRLYAHRLARRRSSDVESDEGESSRQLKRQFAPPAAYSFAPPPAYDEGRNGAAVPSPPPPPPPDDPTGEEAYTRRLRMSQAHQEQLPGPPAQHENMIFDAPSTAQQPPPPPPPPAAAITAINSTGTISRAPVRYNLPAAPSDMPATEAEFEAAMQEPDTPGDDPNNDTNDNANEPEQRSLRPGQKGFAERFMSRYGWTKGSGLGATGSGIINPLRVQVEKQSKKNNKAGNESGGWLGGDDGDRTTKGSSSSSRGKIIGGKKKKGGEEGAGEDEGLFGRMSEVVVLRGMVDGLDLDAEMHGGEGDGGLMQEIGEECSEKYGRVERVFIYRGHKEDVKDDKGPKVFVKFTSQLSALRAVNALQGRIFNGNSISARFFDAERFEDGRYS